MFPGLQWAACRERYVMETQLLQAACRGVPLVQQPPVEEKSTIRSTCVLLSSMLSGGLQGHWRLTQHHLLTRGS